MESTLRLFGACRGELCRCTRKAFAYGGIGHRENLISLWPSSHPLRVRQRPLSRARSTSPIVHHTLALRPSSHTIFLCPHSHRHGPPRHSVCHPLRRIAPHGHARATPFCPKTPDLSTRSHPRRSLPSVHTDRFRVVQVFSISHCSPFLETLLYYFILDLASRPSPLDRASRVSHSLHLSVCFPLCFSFSLTIHCPAVFAYLYLDSTFSDGHS